MLTALCVPFALGGAENMTTFSEKFKEPIFSAESGRLQKAPFRPKVYLLAILTFMARSEENDTFQKYRRERGRKNTFGSKTNMFFQIKHTKHTDSGYTLSIENHYQFGP